MSTGRIMQIFRKGKQLMAQITPVYADMEPISDSNAYTAICHFAFLKYTVGDKIAYFKAVMNNFHKEVGAIYDLLDSVEIRLEMQPEAIKINEIFPFDLEADFLYVCNNTREEIVLAEYGSKAVVESDEIVIMRRNHIINKERYIYDGTIFVEDYGVYKEAVMSPDIYYLIGATIFPNFKINEGELKLCTEKKHSTNFRHLSGIIVNSATILKEAGIDRVEIPYNMSYDFALPNDFDVPIVFSE